MRSIGRGTAVRFKALTLLLLLLGPALAGDYGAKNVWNKLKNKYGSKETLKQNAEKPLMTDTPMKNVQGNISFSAKVQCPSRREGIKITFLPVSGNEYRLVIEQDIDLDGRYEYVYDTQRSVSGVCNGGIISCNPSGSWQNCEYFAWTANQNGYVSLVQTQNTSLLGACFCSNTSCGISNLDRAIVDYIVGGISQAVMRARQDLAVSYAGFDLQNFQAKLYVQDKTQCAYPNAKIYGEINPTQIYENQTPPDGYSYVISQGYDRDTESPYYLVKQSSHIQLSGKTIGYPSRVTCTLRKEVLFTTQTKYENCFATYTWNGKTWCVLAYDYKSCGCHVCATVNASVSVKKGQELYLLVPGYSDNCDDDGNSLRLNVAGDVTLSYSYTCGSWNFKTTRAIRISDGTSPVNVNVDAKRCHEGYCGCSTQSLYLLLSQEYKEDNINLSVSDSCSTKSTQGCTLKNEWICDKNGQNCVQTVREGVRLSVQVQPFCYNVSTQVDSYNVCADGNTISVQSSSGMNDKTFSGTDYWFYVKREYECPPDTIDVDLSRTESVISSTQKSSNTITYQDLGQTYSVDVSSVHTTNCPVAVCTVKLQTQDTSVFVDKTNRAQTPGGSATYRYEKRVCEKDQSGNWTCPLNSGETKVEDCTCNAGLNSVGFTTTISILGSVVEASKDIICSSSPP